MSHIRSLIVRVQRLPHLTKEATQLDAMQKARERLEKALEKLSQGRAQAIALERITDELVIADRSSALGNCFQSINEAADKATSIESALTDTVSGLLPPDA